jgi:hypothetical protein
MIPWPLGGVRVLGPRSSYRSSLQRLRLLWFQLLCDQHHARDFSFNHDVEQQMLAKLWGYHYWQRREVLLQLQECLICFLGPNKGSELLQ